MTTAAHAWVLTDNADHRFAVANVEMVEYLSEATVLDVPYSPAYCPAVMPWRGRLLPVIHYHRLFDPQATAALKHIGVLAYQSHPGEPLQHVALVLGSAPYRVTVTDQESEALPELYAEAAYRPLVRSVFCHNTVSLPVLDVNYLISPALRDLLLKKPEAAAK